MHVGGVNCENFSVDQKSLISGLYFENLSPAPPSKIYIFLHFFFFFIDIDINTAPRLYVCFLAPEAYRLHTLF